MRPTHPATRLARLAALLLLLAAPLPAQDFSPAIVVNDDAITGWEIEQRVRMLEAFNTPGDLGELARTGLVEDRLKAQELARAGISPSEEEVDAAVAEFAGRAGLDPDQFVALLSEAGVDPRSFRDFAATGAAWRDYVRARFGRAVEVTDADVDARLAREGSEAAGVEVLLSEIIIPAPPAEAAQAQAIAEGISRMTSEEAFSAAAREYSATPTRDQGGRLPWAPLTQYPPALRPLLLGLAPGEVTPPLPLQGAVALLQLRGVREGPYVAPEPETVDYAVLRIPGGLSEAALSEARAVAARVDRCDDLYDEARGLPEGTLLREEAADPAAIPPDVALALATLDPDEATWGPTADGGATLLFVMLCARAYPLPEGAADREAVANAIRGERLAQHSDVLVADLRARATIVGE